MAVRRWKRQHGKQTVSTVSVPPSGPVDPWSAALFTRRLKGQRAQPTQGPMEPGPTVDVRAPLAIRCAKALFPVRPHKIMTPPKVALISAEELAVAQIQPPPQEEV